MIIYFFLFVIIIITGLFANYIRNENFRNNIIISISLISFATVMGFRKFTVGTDTLLYKNLFINSGNRTWYSVMFESKYPVYDIYQKIIFTIFGEYQVLLIISACIICFNFFVFFKNFSPNISMSIYSFYTLYVFFTAMNINRQYLAISIVLLSLVYLKINKKLWSLLLIAIAVFIHSSAIISVVIYFLNLIKWTRKKIIMLPVVVIISLSFYEKIIELFVKVFPDYIIYTNNTISTMQTINSGNRIYLSFFYLLILLISMIMHTLNKKKTNENEKLFFYSVGIVSVVLGIIFNRNILSLRVDNYFNVSFLVIIPLLLNDIRDSFNSRYIYILSIYLIGIILLVPLIFQLNKNLSEVLPYLFFWQ